MSRRFSLRALFGLTAVAALALTLIYFTLDRLALRRELHSAVLKQEQLEKNYSLERDRELAQFWGANGDPILVIDLPSPSQRIPSQLILYEIKNSKFTSVHRTHYADPEWKKPTFFIDVRLLRSLDGVDYYRLRYSTGGAKNLSEVVFSYDGTASVLVQNHNVFIAIASSKEDSLAILSKNYDSAVYDTKLAEWSSGRRSPPQVMTPFWPSLGRPWPVSNPTGEAKKESSE